MGFAMLGPSCGPQPDRAAISAAPRTGSRYGGDGFGQSSVFV
jgi:hypothetical protein